MEDDDLGALYERFRGELEEETARSGDEAAEVFFRAYERIAAENGDCIDLDYAPALRDGPGGWRIDGYGLDAERGALYLAICDFRNGEALETLNAAALERIKQRLTSFVEKVTDPSKDRVLSSEDHGLTAAQAVASQIHLVRRLRVVVFSNARLATRRPPEAAGEIAGIPVIYNVLDFSRFIQIQRSAGGSEAIEIDLRELSAAPLVALPASGSSGSCQSYLVAVPGETLANIYGLYGPRLLEQNVRTFLQAKTKVNKGIIRTIREDPAMFFAYNNGITATASGVVTQRAPDGGLVITNLSGLQIVNGGQTTASILYAKDRAGADLREVFVQMKLTIIAPSQLEDVVPRISRYANTQNRISEADFFSSHPFHVALEQLSRRINAPPRPGHVSGSKWFYERARGQYREAGARETGAARTRFDAEFPKTQVIDKTDLAKHALAFDLRPHTVCTGAQKCFLSFAEQVSREWATSPLQFNEKWFRDAVARAIVFRWIDRAIAGSDWYTADKGYKAQTVAYTISWITSKARKGGKAGLDLGLIWRIQDVPEELRQIVDAVAPQIAAALRQAPEAVRNVGEYAKHQACWSAISGLNMGIDDLPDAVLLDREEAAEEGRDAAQARRVDLEIEFDTMLLGMASYAQQITEMAKSAGVLSPKSDAALRKIARGEVLLPAGEKLALKQMLQRLQADGVKIPGQGYGGVAEGDGDAGRPTPVLRLSTTDVRRVRI